MTTPSDGPSIDDLLAAARTGLDRVGPGGLADEVAGGALVIDTRCGEARLVTGVIPGSVHVPLSVLYWRLDSRSPHHDPSLADSRRRVVLVCADGFSSSIAAATLRQLGYARATDLDGGFNGWAEAGMAVERAPERNRNRS